MNAFDDISTNNLRTLLIDIKMLLRWSKKKEVLVFSYLNSTWWWLTTNWKSFFFKSAENYIIVIHVDIMLHKKYICLKLINTIMILKMFNEVNINKSPSQIMICCLQDQYFNHSMLNHRDWWKQLNKTLELPSCDVI